MVLRQLHNTINYGGSQEMNNQKNYMIGLDIGTTSVGYSVVEVNNQKIVRKGNKRLWGVRLFDAATTASERRQFRSTRRRYDRRRYRIQLLQEEFQSEINKIDPLFFQKLKEAFYKEQDIKNKTIKLTKNEKKTMKEYQNKYKTIYHLRNELMNNPEKKDIRLVYLAIHHIIKYRGNFLYNMKDFKVENLNIKDKLQECFLSCEIDDDLIDYETLSQTLLLDSKNDIKVKISALLVPALGKNFASEFAKLIIGNKFDITKMLSIESDFNVSISFSSNDFDEKYEEISNILGEEIEKLAIFKELYDMVFLKKLFKGSKNTDLSSLMIEKYEEHKKDLKFLKDILKYEPASKDKKHGKYYYKVLKSKQDIYTQYIKNKKTTEEFCNEIKKVIEELLNKYEVSTELRTQYAQVEKARLENFTFMPKITDTENGKYPYQLNEEELIKIIENQGKYYPFLLEKIGDKYKLVKLLEFKIPYYVGPLVNKNQSNFAWMISKQEHVKITPYNFDEVVDKEKTAEEFIKRMIGHCTYFLDTPAMPNNSLLYSEYKVRNELKQIRINGEKLTNELQQKIIEDLFMKKSGTITDKIFKNYLRHSSECKVYNELVITGYSADNKFANNLQSYIDFFGVNGIFNNASYTKDNAEEIIEWITIFEDKDILKSKIIKNYPNLSDEQINSILSKKYKGWGNLSKELLTTKYYSDPKTNLKKSILDLMTETEANFMQIINDDKYKFQKMIQEHNHIQAEKGINYNLVKELATSPATKRGIYQSLKVVDELIEYMGYNPEMIVIEMAREEGEKKRVEDRKKQLTKLYHDFKNDIKDYQRLSKELEKQQKINTQKLFLYFIQEGKSLYSGRPLNIEDLDTYEIDHIIPRTLIKDDSIDNKALVYREENQKKAASYILPKEYRTDLNKKWWEHLKKIGLMSPKKFHNLIRTEYKEDDIQGFINRQLVETKQITKHVANILSNLYDKTKIVYLKANLSHYYRERYELFKFRDLNDYHHAFDAYLAAVLGEYKEKYLNTELNFEIVKEMNKKLFDFKDYQKLKYGYVINSLDSSLNENISELSKNYIDMKTGELLFDSNRFNSTIEKNYYCNDILISRKTEIRSGQFFKQTIYPAKVGTIPIKNNLSTQSYGGYSNVETKYLILLKYKNKTKIIGIPMDIASKENMTSKLKDDFIREQLKLKQGDNYTILRDKIPFETMIHYKNQDVYIKGYSVRNKNSELSNAFQLHIPKQQMQTWKHVFNKIFNNFDISTIHDKKILDEYQLKEQAIMICKYLFHQKEKYPLFKKEIIKIEETLNLENLSFEELSKIIKELIKLYHCNSQNANLKDFGLGDRIGRLSGNNLNTGTLIFKSITGIHEYHYQIGDTRDEL